MKKRNPEQNECFQDSRKLHRVERSICAVTDLLRPSSTGLAFFLGLIGGGLGEFEEPLQTFRSIINGASAKVLLTKNSLTPKLIRHYEISLNFAGLLAGYDRGGLLRDMCKIVYRLDGSKSWAVLEALHEGRLRGWKDWDQARSPVGWVREVAKRIHREYEPLPLEQPPRMLSLDVTGDPFAALLRVPDGDRFSLEINTRLDLVRACEREGLAPETIIFELGRYEDIQPSITSEVFGLSKRQRDLASREMKAAETLLQARLIAYQPEKHRRERTG